MLAYHHVGVRIPDVDPDLSISVSRFEAQLDCLVDWGFVGVSASLWLDGLSGDGALPARPVILTFDDGFGALADHALPLLIDRGYSGTVFVVTGHVGGDSAWIDPVSSRRALLGADEIKFWAQHGIEFASHTRSHAPLTALDARQLEDELQGSRDDLSALLGAPPRTLAYPYGAVNAPVRDAAAQLYEAAFTVHEGANGPARDRLLLRRSGALEADSPRDLAFRLRLGWTPQHRMRHRARRRLGATRRRIMGQPRSPF